MVFSDPSVELADDVGSWLAMFDGCHLLRGSDKDGICQVRSFAPSPGIDGYWPDQALYLEGEVDRLPPNEHEMVQ